VEVGRYVVGSVLERRLIFVSGKGGVGKTTVALALGLLAADQGRRCLLVEIDTNGLLPSRFDLPPAKLGVPLQLQTGLYSMNVEGRAALDEYLALILPGPVARTVFSSKIYEYFVAGAPGLKELMCMGKIFYEVERTEKGAPAWDIVIVDAPATGHGLEYYRMPQAAHDTFSVGLVHREGLSAPLLEQLEAFRAALPGATGTEPAADGDQDLVQELVQQTELLQTVHEENLRQVERLRTELDPPLVLLPALFEEQVRPRTMEPLLRELDRQLHDAPAAAGEPVNGGPALS
jgi:anion-transporting  ArsA/GET3 family ATPase